MQNFLNQIFDNKFFSFFLIFILLVIIQEPSFKLFGSEVHYIGETLAKYKFIEHKYSSYITHGSPLDYRYLFDYLTIFIYEIANQNIFYTCIIGRLLCALLFSFAFIHLSKTLNLDVINTLIIICAYMLMNQQLVGGDKLTGNGFNSAAISYSLNILSISFLIRKKLIYSVIFIAISTNFHFVVGGFWATFIFITFFIKTLNLKKTLYFIIFYIILSLPVIILLFSKININDSNLSEIAQITAFRSKHQFLPFYSFEYFIWQIPGIAILLSIVFFIFINKEENETHQYLKILILTVFFQITFSFIISPFDKNFLYSNFAPFRTSTLLLLIIFYYISSKINLYQINKSLKILVLIPFLVNVSYPALGRIIFDNVDNMFENNITSKSELYDFINNETKLEDVIFAVDDYNVTDLELITKRPSFFNWKKIPSNSYAILEWWNRYKILEEIKTKNCKKEYAYINYFIVSAQTDDLKNCGKIVFSNDQFKLLKNL